MLTSFTLIKKSTYRPEKLKNPGTKFKKTSMSYVVFCMCVIS